jgi:hypothetical protein
MSDVPEWMQPAPETKQKPKKNTWADFAASISNMTERELVANINAENADLARRNYIERMSQRLGRLVSRRIYEHVSGGNQLKEIEL